MKNLPSSPSPIHLNIRFLMQGILYRWKLVLIPLLLLPVLTLAFKYKIPRKYKASAKLFVQNSIEVNPFLEDMQVEWTVQSRLPLIQSVINSRTTLEKVLKNMGELKDSDSDQIIDAKVSDLRNRISIYNMGGGLVTIDVVGKSAPKIYTNLKTLTKIFIETMLRPQKQSLEEAQAFLTDQLKKKRQSLSDLEDKIQKFRQDNVEELPEVFQVNMNSFRSTQRSLLESKTELRAAKRRKSNLKARLQLFNPVAREVEANLIREKAKLSELNSIYKSDHPEVIATKERIRKLSQERQKANIKNKDINLAELEGAARMQNNTMRNGPGQRNQGNQTTDIMTSDLLEYKAVMAEIAALNGTTTELKDQSKKSLEATRSYAKTQRVLTGLMRDYEVMQSTYTTLLEHSEDAKIKRALGMTEQQNQVWMIEEPRLPTTPIGIPRKFFVLISIIIGLVLGISIATALELLDHTVRRAEDIEKVCNITVFGVLPQINKN